MFEKTTDSEVIGLDDILATLFCVMEATTEEVKKQMNEDEKYMLSVQIEELFGRCFYKMFPEYAPQEGEEFNLCDAAIIKAQDDIINDAANRGITFEEALKHYNEKAREYVNARKMS